MIHFVKVNGCLVQLEQLEDEKNETVRILGDVLGGIGIFAGLGIIMVLFLTF